MLSVTALPWRETGSKFELTSTGDSYVCITVALRRKAAQLDCPVRIGLDSQIASSMKAAA
jgi:hypothetical protein